MSKCPAFGKCRCAARRISSGGHPAPCQSSGKANIAVNYALALAKKFHINIVAGSVSNLKGGKVGEIAQKLYDNLYGMQTGVVEDDMGWTYPLGF